MPEVATKTDGIDRRKNGAKRVSSRAQHYKTGLNGRGHRSLSAEIPEPVSTADVTQFPPRK
jgi:hypothetical protein